MDLQAFVPDLTWLVDDHGDGAAWRVLDGSLLFADVSGFAALTERLSRRGRLGAEEITDVVSGLFGELLAVARDAGGGLVKFGGDALLLAFSGEGHARRATSAALRMRRSLRQHGPVQTSAGTARVRMATALATGELTVVLAGESHRELLVVGPVVTAVVEAEATAQAGEVVAALSAVASLPAGVLGRDVGVGRVVVRAPTVPAWVDGGVVPERGAAAYVPAAVRDELSAGGGGGEHRQATVGFVRFAGVDDVLARAGPAAVATKLHVLITAAQRAVAASGAVLLMADVARDGGKLLVTGGVPLSRGDDEDAVLHAVRQIVACDCGFALSAGVHTGALFAGCVGSPARRTYTVMGDVVNTAARVMAHAAPGEVLASSATLDATATPWTARAVAPFTAKGVRRPISASVVGAPLATTTESVHAGPFLGRSAERARLADAIDAALAGGGIGAAVVAPAGAGASRLIREALAATPARVVAPRATVEDRFAPYAYARHVLAAFSEDATLPSSDSDAALTPAARADQAAAFASSVFLATRQPTVVLLDHFDAADAPSRSLWEAVAPGLSEAPVALVTTGSAAPPWPCELVELAPLDRDVLVEVARSAGGSALAPDVLGRIAQRAEGNPLVAIRLTEEVVAGGDVDALPASVERLTAATIDALEPRRRDLLRAVSVLGSATSLAAVREVTGATERDLGGLGALLRVDGNVVRFRSERIRDAAYEGLPRRRRRELHAAAAELFEREPDKPGIAEELAVHHFEAGHTRDAWRWSLVAAAEAQSVGAHAQVVRVLRRALRIERESAAPPHEVAQACLLLAQALLDTDYAAASRLAMRSARLATSGRARAAALVVAGNVAASQRLLVAAERRLRAGLRAIEADASPEADATRARLLLARAAVAVDRGDDGAALERANEAVPFALRSDDVRVKAAVELELANALYANSRNADAALHGRMAAAMFEGIGEFHSAAIAWDYVARTHYMIDHRACLAALDEATRCAQRAGSFYLATVIGLNRAQVESAQGHYAEAEPAYLKALQGIRAIGREPAHLLAALTTLHARLGHWSEARSTLGELEAAESPAFAVTVALVGAEVDLYDPSATAEDIARAVARLAGIDAERAGVNERARLERLRAVAAVRMGEPDALARCADAVAYAAEHGRVVEQGLALAALADFSGDPKVRSELKAFAAAHDIIGFPETPPAGALVG